MTSENEARVSAFSRRDVEIAFRLVRGTKPDEADIDHLMNHAGSLDQLRKVLIKEAGPRLHKQFKEIGPNPKLMRAGSQRVDVDVPAAVLERLLAHVESVWRGFGDSDPFWSVLTKFKPAGAETDKETFYATGQRRVELFTAALARNAIDVKSLPVCLEIGSGVGRLTLWLADHFQRVIAADISGSHLKIAEDELRARGKTNVSFVNVSTMAALADIAPFDAFFSMISLQHSPPPVIKHVLMTVLGKLKPGGVGYFQLPTLIPDQVFDAEAYLADPDAHKGMETFAVPQPILFDMFEQLGLKVLEFREDNQVGPQKLSNTILVRKP